MKTDTIAAIATGLSESGIGIVRISGKDAVEIADRIFISKKDYVSSLNIDKKEKFQKKFSLKNVKSHTLHYGYIIDSGKFLSVCADADKVHYGDSDFKLLDEVLVSVMKAPGSYTAEDVVEINCHGGILLLQKVLELVLQNGARAADPGEFTKRAFLNGRMDLSEAEAVMDLIRSKNDFALRASVKQLQGSVSAVVKDLRDKILYEAAFIESALDDPENYETQGYGKKLSEVLMKLSDRIDKLILKADDGRILREGINTVIVGKPNVGKSSFLNSLIGTEKAIVTDIAGTTRDALEENIRLGDISLHVIDTAGIRDTDNLIEKIGVEKAKEYAAEADLLVYIVDSSMPLDKRDEEIIRLIRNQKFIVLLNKSDLDVVITEEDIRKKLAGLENVRVIKISALKKDGMEDFENAVKEMFFSGQISLNDEVIITSTRHKEALLAAKKSLALVRESIESGLSEEFYSNDLMDAYASLGKIIGEEVDDDLIDEIFEKFCMGK